MTLCSCGQQPCGRIAFVEAMPWPWRRGRHKFMQYSQTNQLGNFKYNPALKQVNFFSFEDLSTFMTRAPDKLQMEYMKTVNGDDLLWAMATNKGNGSGVGPGNRQRSGVAVKRERCGV
ncbi:hypothetical protein M8C21_018545 [Ambrosia artemisiifolia]|uniref:Uncharacterized protein n=1 Tax=Ambrosia artemisiifolia TaxID=4212 RepID=A0AAD5G591_AMBAR|nr:hypothetical protein M8C21_018545 [Ambrosia artemisiifolia]